MITVVPTILAADKTSFDQFVNVYKTFATRFQIDISDGAFTPMRTVQLNEITLPTDGQYIWDIHLMTKRPSNDIPAILRLKPSLVILHAEADENLLPIFEQLSANNIKTGVAFKKETYPGTYRQYIEASDHVLIFAGDLGSQGGTADLLQLEKVPIIQSIDQNVEIGWDGGANIDNVRAIAKYDVDVINVGMAISSAENPEEAWKSLAIEAEKQGVNI